MQGSSPRIYPWALIANCELRIANCADCLNSRQLWLTAGWHPPIGDLCQ
ncbi:hypothetical protein [Nostoc commune]|nr:hypothetical protein [Nostoc commune]